MELREFLNVYGSSRPISGISVQSLAKCCTLDPGTTHLTLLALPERTRKRLSQRLSRPLEESSHFGPLPQDKATFCDHLLSIFGDAWDVARYFFIDRGASIAYEEFEESAQSLGLAGIFPNLRRIFRQLVGKWQLNELQFVAAIQSIDCEPTAAGHRNSQLKDQLRGKFASVLESFTCLAAKSPKITVQHLFSRLKVFGVDVRLSQLRESFPHSVVNFQSFKEFWCQKTNYCAVKNCERDRAPHSSYCPQHSQSFCTRTGKFLENLQNQIPKRAITGALKDTSALKRKMESCFPGLTYSKKGITALQEFLAFADKSAFTLSKGYKGRSESPKKRKVAASFPLTAKRFSFSQSPIRRAKC